MRTAFFLLALLRHALGSERCPKRPPALVVSADDARFNHAKRVLHSLRFVVRRVVPPPIDSAEVLSAGVAEFGPDLAHYPRGLKATSNRLAHKAAVSEVGLSNGTCWHYVFEDDIALHPSITPAAARQLVRAGQKLASQAGFVYLGACSTACSSNTSSFKLCFGPCTHAYGVTPERSKTLLEDARNALPRRWTDAFKIRRYLRNCRMHSVDKPNYALDRRLFFDQHLLFLGKQTPFLLVGANLTSPDWWDHYGILYQKLSVFTGYSM